jgi:hypothetical protein
MRGIDLGIFRIDQGETEVIQVNVIEVRAAVARLGMQICVGAPAGLFAIVLILHKNFQFLSQPMIGKEDARFVGYVFIAVALADAFAAYIVKRRIINAAALQTRYSFHPASFARQLAGAYTPMFALCAMPAIYGMICFFLTSDLDTYVLISVICPAAYLFLKPKEEEIERLAAEIFAPTDDGDIHL